MSGGLLTSCCDNANDFAVLSYNGRSDRTSRRRSRNLQTVGRLRSNRHLTSVAIISSQCAADHYNAYAHRRIVIFVEIEKPQKLCGLHLGLQNREIQFFGSPENPADVVDSAVRCFCDSIDSAFNCTRCRNESAVWRNKKTALSSQQVSL